MVVGLFFWFFLCFEGGVCESKCKFLWCLLFFGVGVSFVLFVLLCFVRGFGEEGVFNLCIVLMGDVFFEGVWMLVLVCWLDEVVCRMSVLGWLRFMIVYVDELGFFVELFVIWGGSGGVFLFMS